MATRSAWLRSQLLVTVPVPRHDFDGQTIIVTGANVGLGLEAAVHFVHLNAAKVILAVRSLDKGLAAQREIEARTGAAAGTVGVWLLDMGKYASVKAFAERAAKLPRLDVAVLNAGIATTEFSVLEKDESTITVNVTSTLLLVLHLLPILRRSAEANRTVPRLVVTSSDVHHSASFPERNADSIFDALNDKAKASMLDRYAVSKLLPILLVRSLAARTAAAHPSPNQRVALSLVHPGFCHSALTRSVSGVLGLYFTVMRTLFARTTEAGGRTLVLAAAAGYESNGKYFSDGIIDEGALSTLVTGEEGRRVTEKAWKELKVKLEAIEPGVMSNV